MSRSLTEPEIQRYSRQILVHEVGGVGQRRLLLQPFSLRGRGPALETCAAYVEGAGCPLLPPDRVLEADEVGYLFARDQVGAPLSSVIEKGGQVAADVLRPPGELGQVPADFTSKGPRVALGEAQGRPALVWAAAGDCPGCFAGAVDRLSPPGREDSVVLGSLGALVAVRLVLEEEQGVGAMVLGPQGSERWEVERCEECR